MSTQAGVTVLGRLDVVDVRVSGFMLTPVLAVADRAPVLVASPGEVAAILLPPVDVFLPGATVTTMEQERDGYLHPLRRLSVRGPAHLGCDGARPRPAGCHPRPKRAVSRRQKAFIRHWTHVATPPLVPEVRLYLAEALMPLWQTLARDASDPELPPPYWAFAWAGGQAVARYLLDHPDEVRGARVLDLATGSGLCAIAALQAGARTCWRRYRPVGGARGGPQRVTQRSPRRLRRTGPAR